MKLTNNFTLDEFQRKSMRALTQTEILRARQHAEILQPARDALGRIVISSFVRTGSAVGGGTHANGLGVDFYPLDATMAELFHWLAAHQRLHFGRLIYERDHIHMTLPGDYPGGGRGLTFVEPREGEYFPILMQDMSNAVANVLALPDEARALLPWAIIASIFLVSVLVFA